MTSLLGDVRTFYIGGMYPMKPDPLADIMTHVGQLALLRRLAGAPIPPENFIFADVRSERLGRDQSPPAQPDAEWPERISAPS